MQHKLQSVVSVLPRTTLGVPPTTAHWIACMLAGVYPIQDLIIQAFVQFWNRTLPMMETNDLIRAALHQQVHLRDREAERKRERERERTNGRQKKKKERIHTCWLSHWMNALDTLLPGKGLGGSLRSLEPLDGVAVQDGLTEKHMTLLNSYGNPWDPTRCLKRKIAFVHRLLGSARKWGKIPHMVRLHTSDRIKNKQWCKFLAAQAEVPTEQWQLMNAQRYHERLCMKCNGGHIGSEEHALLHC